MLLVAALLSLLIGLTLGLLGGGGSILTLPVLVYVLHVEAKEAIASSLIVVGATALVGAAAHARARNVDYRTGAIFGAASMAGAFGGGTLAGYVRGDMLLIAFAVVMLVTAVAMMRPRREPPPGERRTSMIRVLAVGALVGVVSGLVGAGGGFLIVPALVLFGGVDMRRAIGTSLFVLTLQSFAGFAGHAAHTHVDWMQTGLVTGLAVLGSLAGARLAKHMSVAALRRGFAWFVLAMAVFMVGRQISVQAAVAAGAGGLLLTFFLSRRKDDGQDRASIAQAPKAEQST